MGTLLTCVLHPPLELIVRLLTLRPATVLYRQALKALSSRPSECDLSTSTGTRTKRVGGEGRRGGRGVTVIDVASQLNHIKNSGKCAIRSIWLLIQWFHLQMCSVGPRQEAAWEA